MTCCSNIQTYLGQAMFTSSELCYVLDERWETATLTSASPSRIHRRRRLELSFRLGNVLFRNNHIVDNHQLTCASISLSSFIAYGSWLKRITYTARGSLFRELLYHCRQLEFTNLNKNASRRRGNEGKSRYPNELWRMNLLSRDNNEITTFEAIC